MRIVNCLLLATVITAVFAVGGVCAQEATDPPAETEAAAAPAGPATEAYQKKLAEWKDLLTELQTLRNDYTKANQEERAEIREKFGKLAEKGEAMREELAQSAEKAFIEAPNADKDLTDLLLELTSDNIRRDDYLESLRLAKVLIDNKCDSKHVYDLAGVAAFAACDFDAAEKYLAMAKEKDALTQMGEMRIASLPKYKKLWAEETKLREAEAKADDLPRVLLKTNKGDIELELFENEAPLAVANFVSLVDKGYYDGLVFHRVLPGFMAQGGCPEGTGTGGPGYNIPCECQKPEHRKHFIGSISMAHAGRDTGGSQFFLTFLPTEHLDGRHTVFGRVINGFDVLPKLQRRDPSRSGGPDPDKIEKATVVRKRDHEYKPTKAE